MRTCRVGNKLTRNLRISRHQRSARLPPPAQASCRACRWFCAGISVATGPKASVACTAGVSSGCGQYNKVGGKEHPQQINPPDHRGESRILQPAICSLFPAHRHAAQHLPVRPYSRLPEQDHRPRLSVIAQPGRFTDSINQCLRRDNPPDCRTFLPGFCGHLTHNFTNKQRKLRVKCG